MKKPSEETQTLRAGCSKAEPKNFAPPQTPFPGARDGPNLISWRWSLYIFIPTNPVWWGSMHTISSYRGNRPTRTHKHPHPQTHRTDYNTLQHRNSHVAGASAYSMTVKTKACTAERSRAEPSAQGYPRKTSCISVSVDAIWWGLSQLDVPPFASSKLQLPLPGADMDSTATLTGWQPTDQVNYYGSVRTTETAQFGLRRIH